MSRRNPWSSLLLGVLATSCAAQDAPAADDPIAGVEVVEQRVFWLDDHTLVFPGRADAETDFGLYVWQPGVSAPRRLAGPAWDSEHAVFETHLCASHGRVVFAKGAPRSTETPGQMEYDGLAGPPDALAPSTVRTFRNAVGVTAPAEPRGMTPSNGVWSVYGRRVGVDCEESFNPDRIGQWWAVTFPGRPDIVFDRTDDDGRFINARLTAGASERSLDLPTRPPVRTAPCGCLGRARCGSGSARGG